MYIGKFDIVIEGKPKVNYQHAYKKHFFAR